MNNRVERLILASTSPRRIELIERFNIPFRNVAISVDESFDKTIPVINNLLNISYLKASAAAQMGLEKNEVVLSADTVVVLSGEVLTKPRDEADAADMLRALSGNVHSVETGVTLLSNEKNVSFSDVTLVHFAKMSEEEISYYIRSGEPMDKAGAYGIQGLGSLYISGIEGCYYNVMGLPVPKIYKILKAEFM